MFRTILIATMLMGCEVNLPNDWADPMHCLGQCAEGYYCNPEDGKCSAPCVSHYQCPTECCVKVEDGGSFCGARERCGR